MIYNLVKVVVQNIIISVLVDSNGFYLVYCIKKVNRMKLLGK